MVENRKKLRIGISWLDGKSVPLQALSPMSEQEREAASNATQSQAKEQRRIKTEYENGVFARRFVEEQNEAD